MLRAAWGVLKEKSSGWWPKGRSFLPAGRGAGKLRRFGVGVWSFIVLVSANRSSMLRRLLQVSSPHAVPVAPQLFNDLLRHLRSVDPRIFPSVPVPRASPILLASLWYPSALLGFCDELLFVALPGGFVIGAAPLSLGSDATPVCEIVMGSSRGVPHAIPPPKIAKVFGPARI